MRSILAIVALVMFGVPDTLVAQQHLLITCGPDGDQYEMIDGKTGLEVGVDTLEAYLMRELSRDGALSADDEAWIAGIVETARRHATQHVEAEGTVHRGSTSRRKVEAAHSPGALRVEVRRAYHSTGSTDLK